MNKMIFTLLIALVIVINTSHAACPFLGLNEFLDNLINLEFLQFSTPALRLGSNHLEEPKRKLRVKPKPAPAPAPNPTNNTPPPPKPAPAPATSAPTLLPVTSTSLPPTSSSSGLSNPQCLAGFPLTPISNALMCQLTTDIKNSFLALMAKYDSTPATAKSMKSALFGPALRLAFHDAGEVLMTNTNDKLGPDGCLSKSSDHAGLIEATSAVVTLIEPEWQKFCSRGISRADFWALYGKLVVEYASAPEVTVSIPFYYGRKDATTCDAGAGRMPQGSTSTFSSTLSFFTSNMGLTTNDAITLIGAHTLGHVSPSKSGFGITSSTSTSDQKNSWDGTPDKFDNKYYKDILNIPWSFDPTVTGTNGHLQDYIDKNGGNQIMLNADMSLAFVLTNNGQLQQVCGGQRNNCGRESATLTLVNSFIDPTTGNNAFIQAFKDSYVKMVNAGYSYGTVTNGKIGTLTLLQQC